LVPDSPGYTYSDFAIEPYSHDYTGVTTPNVKNRTLESVAQTCCLRKTVHNRFLQGI